MSEGTFTTASGLRAALPIILAYLPVAFAFGAAASGLGITPGMAAAMSALMFSGANQAFFITSVAAGVPMLAIVALCGAVSLRHLLYGLILKGRIQAGVTTRAVFAFGLTDEVFATVLGSSTAVEGRPGGAWLVTLAFSAWFTWVGGTLVGATAGNALQALDARATEAIGFALPALFIGLIWTTVRLGLVGPMVLAGLIAGVLVWADLPQWAIPAAGLAAFATPGTRRA